MNFGVEMEAGIRCGERVIGEAGSVERVPGSGGFGKAESGERERGTVVSESEGVILSLSKGA